MTVHQVRHLLRPGDYVRTEFRCIAPEGAKCRMTCATCADEAREVCECETLFVEPRTPVMRDVGCMVIPWLEEVSEEAFNGEGGEGVRGPGWQDILEEWLGDDYGWDYAT